MSKELILLVDDDMDILETSKFLLQDSYEVLIASSVPAAKAIIKTQAVQVAVVDLNFEGHAEDGLVLIDFINKESPETSVVVLSSDCDTKRVVEAMRRSLVDFVTKEADSEKTLRKAIASAIDKKQQSRVRSTFEFQTQSPTLRRILANIEQVILSGSNAPILILGESGSGKEILAKYIAQKLSKRLVAANMASIPKETAESELFGHIKGSFTGAHENKTGLIETANKGVFFLDEIGDCSLSIQSKLLRVIQEKEVLPVGATTSRKIETRFVAATHCNLDSMVKCGEFRLDLFQRLNTFTFKIPPLRERPEDISFYTHLFIEEISQGTFFKIEEAGLNALMSYSWPGNVRELRNVIERVVVFSKRKALDLETAQLALSNVSLGENSIMFDDTKRYFSQEEILRALEQFDGNRTKASALLKIHVTTMRRWMKKYGLEEFLFNNGRRSLVQNDKGVCNG